MAFHRDKIQLIQTIFLSFFYKLKFLQLFATCAWQDMEDVLKEQATLYPQDAESQAKLVGFYSEARRYEDCVQVILRVEGTQEMRTSPRWYKECLSAFSVCSAL